MRKLIILLTSFYLCNTASAQAVNWYTWIINNSTNKNIAIKDVDQKWWDNSEKKPCDTNWNFATTKPGETSLKCGGTNSKSVNAWFAYVILVSDNNNNVIYEKRHSWDVHNDYNANLSIKNGSWDDGGTAQEMQITNDLSDKDAVVLYIFDDYGFSTTLLYAGSQYSYDINNKNFNLNEKKCLDPNNPNGCVVYHRYN